MPLRGSVPFSLIDAFLAGPKSGQLDLEMLLRSAGASPELIAYATRKTDELNGEQQDQNKRLDLDQFGALVNGIWNLMDDEASGCLVRPLPTGVFSMMCHAIITAGNLRKALLRSAKFIHFLADDLRFELLEQGDEAHWIIHYDNRKELDPSFFIISFFVIWLRLSCWLIDRPILLERVQFSFGRPAYSSELPLMFPCRQSFGQNSNRLVFNRHILENPICQDSHSLVPFLQGAPESLLTQFRLDDSLTAQVKRLLLHRHAQVEQTKSDESHKISWENLSFDQIAAEFSLTTHTLRRRLKEEGNSFQEIKDSIRRGYAIQLLISTAESLDSIAVRLGFSESAAFNRAFKKWTGMTPGVYRERNLQSR